MANKKWFYRLERNRGGSREVEHLTIEVLPSETDGSSCREPLFTFGWQTHKEDGQFRSWYGFHIEIENCSGLNDLEEVTKVARRLLRDDERPYRDWSPREILDQLREKLRARRVVYDRRVSDMVPIEELAPPEVSCWIDDYRAMNRECCQVGVLATTQDEAQTLMLGEALRLGYESWLARFIQAGKPVFIRDHGAPEWESLGELLAVGDEDPLMLLREGEL